MLPRSMSTAGAALRSDALSSQVPMAESSSKRLSKAERRAQLLDTALDVVRDEGTDALTLARVAERAGVSKPIAYQHFETRGGLLVALYERMDEAPRAKLVAAL